MQTIEEKKAADKERHRRSMALKRAVYKATLDLWREEESSSSNFRPWSPGCEQQAASAAKTAPSLYDDYVGAVELGNAIHLENEGLKERLSQYRKFESRLHRDVMQLDGLTGGAVPRNCLHFDEDDEQFYYEAVDAKVCHDIVWRRYPLLWNHHARFIQNEALESTPFFGWSAQRRVNYGHHFHFSKRVPCANGAHVAEFIGDEAWRVINTPELYERLFSARVAMRVLQRVDANTSVTLQSLPAIDNSTRRRCLTLASKIVNVDEAGAGHRVVTVLLLGVTPTEEMAKRNAPAVQFVPDTDAYLVLHQRVDESGHEFLHLSFGLHGEFASDAEADSCSSRLRGRWFASSNPCCLTLSWLVPRVRRRRPSKKMLKFFRCADD
ncbi:hypothetical protein PHYPSEUDO_001714 [Phytophthora pseudosyringae]|uniref:Uncharacterized protein n=1 Tax=Phytophthora pseudosyringae TaxID=221518 RepID=A0A8T1VVA5_9STRA|nr:hypothetical protein PHYPSEUDO_001714 [Phytophthora pseudosyringae]